ncbi:hypothetical protein BD779DRAFT_1064655 [Infundibulicybe gibba]|nr:hypothetical protein BD779DRAFT_1064655 [Infundibulicybe gibba]
MAWFLLLLISALVGIMAGILVRLPYPPSNTESTSNLSLSQTAITITTNIPLTTTVSTTPVLTTLLTNFQTSTVGIPPRSSGRETLSSIPTTLTAATIIPSASQHMLETTTPFPQTPPAGIEPTFSTIQPCPQWDTDVLGSNTPINTMSSRAETSQTTTGYLTFISSDEVPAVSPGPGKTIPFPRSNPPTSTVYDSSAAGASSATRPIASAQSASLRLRIPKPPIYLYQH